MPAGARAGTPLVIACGLNTGPVRWLRRLACRGGLGQDELILTGRGSQRTLAGLYRSTLAFVFASTEEGLGMPPIETMSPGCPTIVARSSPLVELTDNPAVFFDGLDVDIARALRRVVTDGDHRAALLDSGAATARRLTGRRRPGERRRLSSTCLTWRGSPPRTAGTRRRRRPRHLAGGGAAGRGPHRRTNTIG